MGESLTYHFGNVSLLITVYNRSSSLANLLQAFRALRVSFGEIIVSDDGSKPEHILSLTKLTAEYGIRLIETPFNAGLGNNINKGQAAVKLPYTVYIQEDFIPKEDFGEYFKKFINIMEGDQSIDVIRFYGYFNYPYVRDYNADLAQITFQKSLFYGNHLKFYVYSDHPHLRRSTFPEKFGLYEEGLKGDITELHMSFSFIKGGGKALVMKDLTLLIDQVNTVLEPTTMGRQEWRTKKNPIMSLLRLIYLKFRLVKNTIQLYLN